MLNNHVIYIRLEKEIDKKIQYLHRDNFYNTILIIGVALLLSNSLHTHGTIASKDTLIGLTLFLVLITPYARRLILDNILRIKSFIDYLYGAGVDSRQLKQSASLFLSEYYTYKKELCALYDTFKSADEENIDFYTLVFIDDLEFIFELMKDIEELIDNDKYNGNNRDKQILHKKYIQMRDIYSKVIELISEKNRHSKLVKDLKNRTTTLY
ncbi:MAG: hypothetical protein ABW088_05335 [Sedimenticola sp.]